MYTSKIKQLEDVVKSLRNESTARFERIQRLRKTIDSRDKEIDTLKQQDLKFIDQSTIEVVSKDKYTVGDVVSVKIEGGRVDYGFITGFEMMDEVCNVHLGVIERVSRIKTVMGTDKFYIRGRDLFQLRPEHLYMRTTTPRAPITIDNIESKAVLDLPNAVWVGESFFTRYVPGILTTDVIRTHHRVFKDNINPDLFSLMNKTGETFEAISKLQAKIPSRIEKPEDVKAEDVPVALKEGCFFCRDHAAASVGLGGGSRAVEWTKTTVYLGPVHDR